MVLDVKSLESRFFVNAALKSPISSGHVPAKYNRDYSFQIYADIIRIKTSKDFIIFLGVENA